MWFLSFFFCLCLTSPNIDPVVHHHGVCAAVIIGSVLRSVSRGERALQRNPTSGGFYKVDLSFQLEKRKLNINFSLTTSFFCSDKVDKKGKYLQLNGKYSSIFTRKKRTLEKSLNSEHMQLINNKCLLNKCLLNLIISFYASVFPS